MIPRPMHESLPQPEKTESKPPFEAGLYFAYARRRLAHDNEFGAYMPGLLWPLTLLHERAQRVRDAVVPQMLAEMQEQEVEGVLYQRTDLPGGHSPKQADVYPQLYVAVTQRGGEPTGVEPRGGSTGRYALEVARVADDQTR